ncbi:MAG TPA: nickel-responsive transcriptional regulator NikR [Methylocella sp.]|nr:nickel-responsive transcriptional regulator NikR [Methylocella sp.]
MQRVTLSLDDELMTEIDSFMQARGYQNRSEAIRDLARAGMQQARQDSRGAGHCVAALVYVYDQTVRELAKRLAGTYHDHHDLSVAALQVHLDHSSCMEIAVLRGETQDVHALGKKVIAERGVRHGQLVSIPVELKNETHPHGSDRARRHSHLHVRHAG